MKSKNLFSKAAVIVLTALILFVTTGCNNIFSGTNIKSDKARIVLSIEKVGRTINPKASADMLKDIVLTAKSGNEEAKQITSWATYADMQGKQIELEVGTYTFELTAKKGGTTFKGSIQKEITADTVTELNFKLSISNSGAATATGSIDLKFYYKDSGLDVNTILLLNANSQVIDTKIIDNDNTAAGTGEYAGYRYIHYEKTVPVGLYAFMFETSGSDKKAWSNNYINVSADLTSEAIFKIDQFVPVYTVTYDYQIDGVENDEAYFVISNEEMDTLEFDTEEFSDYLFCGWYRNPECSGDAVETLNLLEETGNLTLYAKCYKIATPHIKAESSNRGVKITITRNGSERFSYIRLTADHSLQIPFTNELLATLNREGSVTITYPFTESDKIYYFDMWMDKTNGGVSYQFYGKAGGGIGEAKEYVNIDAVKSINFTLSNGDEDGTEDKYAYWQLPQGYTSCNEMFTDNRFTPVALAMEMVRDNDYFTGVDKSISSTEVSTLLATGKTDLYELFNYTRLRLNTDMTGYQYYSTNFAIIFNVSDNLIEGCNIDNCHLQTELVSSDSFEYVPAYKTILEDSSEHITLRKHERGIEVTVRGLDGEGQWWGPTLTEDSTGIGLKMETAPAPGEELVYIYPFTEADQEYSFTFHSNTEFGGYSEEKLSCTAGGGDNSFFTLNDAYRNARFELADGIWGEPYLTNYKLTEDICSIFNDYQNKFDEIKFSVTLNSGDLNWIDTEWATEIAVTYWNKNVPYNSNEYNDFLSGNLYVDEFSDVYNTLLKRRIWCGTAQLLGKITGYDGTFIFAERSDEEIFVPVADWLAHNSAQSNSDGTISIRAFVPEGASIIGINCNDGQGRGRFSTYLPLSDNPQDQAYLHDGYVDVVIPSPFTENEDIELYIDLEDEEEETCSDGTFFIKAVTDGNLAGTAIANPDGTITVDIPFCGNPKEIIAQCNIGDRHGYFVYQNELTEQQRNAGRVEFTFDSYAHLNDNLSIVIATIDEEGNYIYMVCYYAIATSAGINESHFVDNGDGTYSVKMPVMSDEVKRIRAQYIVDGSQEMPLFYFDVTDEDIAAQNKEVIIPSIVPAGKNYALVVSCITDFSGYSDGYDYWYEETFEGVTSVDGKFLSTVTETDDGKFTIKAPVIDFVESLTVEFCKKETDSSGNDFDNYAVGPVTTITSSDATVDNGYWEFTVPSLFDENTPYWVRINAYSEDDFYSEELYSLCNNGVTVNKGIGAKGITENNDGTFTITSFVEENDVAFAAVCLDSSWNSNGPEFIQALTEDDIKAGYVTVTIPSVYSSGDSYLIFTGCTDGTGEDSSWEMYDGYAQYDGTNASTLTQNADGSLTFNVYVQEGVSKLSIACDDYNYFYAPLKQDVTSDEINTGRKQFTVPSVFNIDEDIVFTVSALDSTNEEIYSYSFDQTALNTGNAVPSLTQTDDGMLTFRMLVAANTASLKLKCNNTTHNYIYSGLDAFAVTSDDIAANIKEFTVPSTYLKDDPISFTVESYDASDSPLYSKGFSGTAAYTGKAATYLTENSNGTFTLNLGLRPAVAKIDVCCYTATGGLYSPYPYMGWTVDSTDLTNMYKTVTFDSPYGAGSNYKIEYNTYKENSNSYFYNEEITGTVVYQGAAYQQSNP